jgi:hypothetical protein
MSMASAQVWVGVALMVASVPLILRMVPRNNLYGVRTRKALVSDRSWYEINAFGGKLLLVFGALMVGIGYFSERYALPPTSPWASAFVAAPLLLLLPFMVAIRLYSRRFPDE